MKKFKKEIAKMTIKRIQIIKEHVSTIKKIIQGAEKIMLEGIGSDKVNPKDRSFFEGTLSCIRTAVIEMEERLKEIA